MDKESMSNYMRQQMWMDRVMETIDSWERIQEVTLPPELKDSVANFMKLKIKRGLKKNTLMKLFMQIAVTSLLYIKIKGWDNK